MTNQESATPEVLYPGVDVELSGEDGNVFLIVGRVARALRRAGHADAADEFSAAVKQCGSYDEVLQLAMHTVAVS